MKSHWRPAVVGFVIIWTAACATTADRIDELMARAAAECAARGGDYTLNTMAANERSRSGIIAGSCNR